MAANPLPLTPLQDLFDNVMSLNLAQRTCLHNEDIFTLDDLLDLSPKEMSEWANRKSGLTAARGGCRWGIAAIKKLQALIFWAIDSNRRGINVVPADFTPDVMAQYREFVRVDLNTEASEDKTELPGALKDAKWVEWNITLHNYLMAKKGINGIPLAYVIRKPIPPGTMFPTLSREQQLLYAAPLTGPAFVQDNKAVFTVLNTCCMEQNATNWIQPKHKRSSDGRAAMEDLRRHYDGTDGRFKRKSQADAALEVLHYTHEHSLPFSTFSSRMKKHFDTIKYCDPPGVSAQTQIAMLLKKIRTTNVSLLSAIANIRMDPVKYCDFDTAAHELSTQIAIIFPSKSGGNGPGGHRKRDIASLQKGNGGNGGGRGYNIQKVNGRDTINGVDVTDRTREFTKDEWYKLPRKLKDDLNRMPERREMNKKLRSRPRLDTRNSSGFSTQVTLSDETRSQLITGAARAVLSVHSGGPPRQVDTQQPRMGAGGGASRRSQTAGAATGNRGTATDDSASVISDISSLRWDMNGNPIN